jgi:phosphoribosylamine--glycine ligase
MFIACEQNKLEELQVEFNPDTASTVMLVSGGYPGSYTKGEKINYTSDHDLIFHAGTKMQNGELLTNGGRVMSITAFGENMDKALAACYREVENISWEGMYFRKDIGFDLK